MAVDPLVQTQTVPNPAAGSTFTSPAVEQQYQNPYTQNGQTFFAQSPTTNPPAAAPTVVSADKASQDLAAKQASLNTTSAAMSAQSANTAATTANANAQSQQAKPVTAEDIQKAVKGGYDYASIGLQPNPPDASKTYDTTSAPQGYKYMYDSAGNRVQVPESPADTTNDELKRIQEKQDQAYQTVQSQLTQLQQGTFPLTVDQQAQVNALTQQFEQLKAQQRLTNANYEGGVTNAGIAAGRNRYAPEIELGNIMSTVSAGIAKIADIDAKAASAIAQLRQGFADNNYKLINASYEAASKYFSEKSNTVQQMSDNVRQQAQDAIAQHQRDVEQQRYDQQRSDAAIKFAQENKVTLPFYLLGNTAIDARTGDPVDLATYQKLTGQQVGLPEDQTDFSKIQTGLQSPADRAAAQSASQYQQTFAENRRQFNVTEARQRAQFAATQVKASVGADTVDGLAQQLVSGNLAPSELSKRSTGVGSYSSILAAADKYAMATTGKHFNIAQADRDYKFANSAGTQNTLNYLKSLVGTTTEPGNLGELKTLSDSVSRTKFPKLNDAAAWARIQSGDPTITAYYATVTEVADQIAKILQGGGTGSGTSDAKLAQAQALFQSGFNKQQIEATINAMKPLLMNRAKSMIGDNPYLSDYAEELGLTENIQSKEDFTTAAKAEGWSPEEINSYLKNKGIQ